MILLPDGSSGHTYHWAVNTGTHEDALGSDDGDTSYVACSANNRQLILTYANPSVAEADIASIADVTFVSSGRSTDRSNPALVDIAFAAPTAGFSETASYNAHAFSYETILGTERTTSDGSNAWTYSDLENLQMKCTKNSTVQVRLSYLVLRISYIAAVDNAIFFGTNF